jgi:hypothetical protein
MLRPKVYVFRISFVTVPGLRFGAITMHYREVGEERWGEGNLTAKPLELRPLVDGSQQRGGVAQGSGPFYSALQPGNLAGNTQIYLFTPMISSLNG